MEQEESPPELEELSDSSKRSTSVSPAALVDTSANKNKPVTKLCLALLRGWGNLQEDTQQRLRSQLREGLMPSKDDLVTIELSDEEYEALEHRFDMVVDDAAQTALGDTLQKYDGKSRIATDFAMKGKNATITLSASKLELNLKRDKSDVGLGRLFEDITNINAFEQEADDENPSDNDDDDSQKNIFYKTQELIVTTALSRKHGDLRKCYGRKSKTLNVPDVRTSKEGLVEVNHFKDTVVIDNVSEQPDNENTKLVVRETNIDASRDQEQIRMPRPRHHTAQTNHSEDMTVFVNSQELLTSEKDDNVGKLNSVKSNNGFGENCKSVSQNENFNIHDYDDLDNAYMIFSSPKSTVLGEFLEDEDDTRLEANILGNYYGNKENPRAEADISENQSDKNTPSQESNILEQLQEIDVSNIMAVIDINSDDEYASIGDGMFGSVNPENRLLRTYRAFRGNTTQGSHKTAKTETSKIVPHDDTKKILTVNKNINMGEKRMQRDWSEPEREHLKQVHAVPTKNASSKNTIPKTGRDDTNNSIEKHSHNKNPRKEWRKESSKSFILKLLENDNYAANEISVRDTLKHNNATNNMNMTNDNDIAKNSSDSVVVDCRSTCNSTKADDADMEVEVDVSDPTPDQIKKELPLRQSRPLTPNQNSSSPPRSPKAHHEFSYPLTPRSSSYASTLKGFSKPTPKPVKKERALEMYKLGQEKLNQDERNIMAKRVELPDIEEVRRHNRNMLTAQVTPTTQPQSEAVESCGHNKSPKTSSSTAAAFDGCSRCTVQRLASPDDSLGGKLRRGAAVRARTFITSIAKKRKNISNKDKHQLQHKPNIFGVTDTYRRKRRRRRRPRFTSGDPSNNNDNIPARDLIILENEEDIASAAIRNLSKSLLEQAGFRRLKHVTFNMPTQNVTAITKEEEPVYPVKTGVNPQRKRKRSAHLRSKSPDDSAVLDDDEQMRDLIILDHNETCTLRPEPSTSVNFVLNEGALRQEMSTRSTQETNQKPSNAAPISNESSTQTRKRRNTQTLIRNKTLQTTQNDQQTTLKCDHRIESDTTSNPSSLIDKHDIALPIASVRDRSNSADTIPKKVEVGQRKQDSKLGFKPLLFRSSASKELVPTGAFTSLCEQGIVYTSDIEIHEAQRENDDKSCVDSGLADVSDKCVLNEFLNSQATTEMSEGTPGPVIVNIQSLASHETTDESNLPTPAPKSTGPRKVYIRTITLKRAQRVHVTNSSDKRELFTPEYPDNTQDVTQRFPKPVEVVSVIDTSAPISDQLKVENVAQDFEKNRLTSVIKRATPVKTSRLNYSTKNQNVSIDSSVNSKQPSRMSKGADVSNITEGTRTNICDLINDESVPRVSAGTNKPVNTLKQAKPVSASYLTNSSSKVQGLASDTKGPKEVTQMPKNIKLRNHQAMPSTDVGDNTRNRVAALIADLKRTISSKPNSIEQGTRGPIKSIHVPSDSRKLDLELQQTNRTVEAFDSEAIQPKAIPKITLNPTSPAYGNNSSSVCELIAPEGIKQEMEIALPRVGDVAGDLHLIQPEDRMGLHLVVSHEEVGNDSLKLSQLFKS